MVHREEKHRKKVIKEFSRFAHVYDKYNVIQAKVADSLVVKVPKKHYPKVIDIGCGSGEVFKNFYKKGISFENFIAIDSSKNMLNIHPSKENIQKICLDFNNLEHVTIPKADLLVSSSALQWSSNLDYTVKKLSTFCDIFYVTLFTSNTFKTLHETAEIKSPIYTTAEIENIFRRHFSEIKLELHQYRLDFDTTREMFKYIKQSGVSSGERKLSYKQTKKLMKEYPLTYLEFEVLFIVAKK
jgi:malonyl-CoA O-methyltransferase